MQPHFCQFAGLANSASAGTMAGMSELQLSVEDALVLRPDIMQPLDSGAVFGNDHPVELELGAGDGSFLIRHATAHLERNFLGVERLLGRMRKIDRKARRLGLIHVRAMRIEASYLLDWMTPPGSLAAIHVYFPDPWPKRRHLSRRLVNDAFPELAARGIMTGGWMHVRTDHVEYFEQMVRVFSAAHSWFTRETTDPALLEVKTDFEVEFNAKGIPTNHASWRRTGVAAPIPVRKRLDDPV